MALFPPPLCESTDAGGGTMRVHVHELIQLFSAIDPSPLQERDLDPEAERFIVGWARDLPSCAPLALEVDVDVLPSVADPGRALADAVHAFFKRRSDTARRELRTLLRRGRISLVIGLVFLSVCVLAGNFAAQAIHPLGLSLVTQQGLTVAGWVSMWRPMEIFLYAWWPLLGDRRLYDRLCRMPVRVDGAHQSQHAGAAELRARGVHQDSTMENSSVHHPPE